MRPILLRVLVFFIAMVPLAVFSAVGEKEARSAGELFVAVLTSGQPAQLDPILPKSGKILVSLRGKAACTGQFGISQARALLQSYLSQGTGRNGQVLHLEVQSDSYARVELSILRAMPDGATQTVHFRLGLQPENGHWVLREIRESDR